MLEQSRLLRNVEILQTVYVELMKQMEIVKIDEIKDTPILNVKELAREPIKKSGPPRSIIFLTIIISAFFLSFLYFSYQKPISKFIDDIRS